MIYTLKNITHMEIETPNGIVTGGSQLWYSDRWQRLSGCGPTAAANLIWYAARSRQEIALHCEDDYWVLQDEMFGFVTPQRMGVNTSTMFSDGLKKYGNARGISFETAALEFPKFCKNRPNKNIVRDFTTKALEADCPIAFLNLSNGNQKSLESWHWVTIIGFDDESFAVSISDHGRIITISLSAWMKSSLLGGALVYLKEVVI